MVEKAVAEESTELNCSVPLRRESNVVSVFKYYVSAGNQGSETVLDGDI